MKSSNKEEVERLIYACSSGNDSLVDILLQKGVDVNAIDNEQKTPLIHACKNGHRDIAEKLIEKGADINKVDIENKTPLMYACIKKDEGMVDLLVENGANLELSDNRDKTALIHTCENYNKGILHILLNAGCDINKRNKKNMTPLMTACKEGKMDIAELLIKNGADLEAEDKDSGWTALNYACMYNHINISDKLLESGVNINKENSQGITVLGLSLMSANYYLTKHLLDKGADIERVNNYRNGAIKAVCMNNDKRSIQVLLENGLDIKLLQNAYQKRGALHKWNEVLQKDYIKKTIADVEAIKERCSYAEFKKLQDILQKNKQSMGYRKIALQQLLNMNTYENEILDKRDELVKNIVVELQEMDNTSLKRWAIFSKNEKVIDELIKEGVITKKDIEASNIAIFEGLDKKNNNEVVRDLLNEYIEEKNKMYEEEIALNEQKEEVQQNDYKKAFEVSILNILPEKITLGKEAQKEPQIGDFMNGLKNITEYKDEPRDSGLQIYLNLIDRLRQESYKEDNKVYEYMISITNILSPLPQDELEKEEEKLGKLTDEVKQEIREKYFNTLDKIEQGITGLYNKLINNEPITAAPQDEIQRREHYDKLLNGFRLVGEIIEKKDFTQIGSNLILIADLDNWCAGAWKDTLEELMVMYRNEIYQKLDNKIGISEETDKIKRRLTEVFFDSKKKVLKDLSYGIIKEKDIDEDYRPHCIGVYTKYLNEKYNLHLPQTDLSDSFAINEQNGELTDFFDGIRNDFIEYLQDKDVEELITEEAVRRYNDILTGDNAQKTQNEVVDWTYSYMLRNGIKDISRVDFLSNYIYNDTVTAVRKIAIEEIFRDKGFINKGRSDGIDLFKIKQKVKKAIEYCDNQEELANVRRETKIFLERLKMHKAVDKEDVMQEVIIGIIRTDKWMECLDLLDICIKEMPGEKDKIIQEIIKKNSVELLDTMAKKGVDIYRPDEENHMTPLMYACINCDVNIIDYLIKNNAEINVADNDGTTPLMYATTGKNSKVIEYLLNHGADVNMRENNKVTALIYACLAEDIKTVKLLVEHGADVNMKEENGYSALIIVAKEGDLDITKYLVEHGAKINMESISGNTPLMVACQAGQTNIVKYLLEKEAHINCINKEGNTPLMESCARGYLDIVKHLIRNGAKLDIVNDNGEDVLSLAINNNRLKVAEYLIKRVPNMNRFDEEGFTPLMLAITKNNTAMVEMLLQAGVNCNIKNKNGQDALYLAKEVNNKDIIRLITKNLSKDMKLELKGIEKI